MVNPAKLCSRDVWISYGYVWNDPPASYVCMRSVHFLRTSAGVSEALEHMLWTCIVPSVWDMPVVCED